MPRDLNLAAVGNCIVAALIDRQARIVWWCLPRLDGDPVFCGLLDGEAERGVATVEAEDTVETHQAYLPNTAIVVTTLVQADGTRLRVTDFCPRFRQFDRLYRAPMLIRRIEPEGGPCRVTIRLRPRCGYGAAEPTRVLGSNHLRFVSPDAPFRVTTDAPIAYLAAEAPFVLTHPVTLIFGPDESLEASITHTTRDFFERTRDYWVEWTRYLAVPFEWQDAVIRAAISLKLCSYEETGAIVAALTTSIPEAPGTVRNWDYRHCWLRDAFFVVHALNRLGATRTMEDYLGYITTASSIQPELELRPVYGIVPSEAIDERFAASLPGYRGMGPVRIGNEAALQKQNDVYGSVVLAAAQSFFDQRLLQTGNRALFDRLERLGTRAAALALEPDAGLWEYRGRALVHTHSAAMCWAACARLSRIAARLELHDRAAHWRITADALRGSILEQAWSTKRNSFAGTLGGDELDASALLLQEIGLVCGQRSALRRHRRDDRQGAGARQSPDALRDRGRFRPARDRLHDLQLLVRRCTGRDRPSAGGARAVLRPAPAAQPRGAALRGHRRRHRRALGKLPADLLDGRPRHLRHAPEQDLGRGLLARRVTPLSRRARDSGSRAPRSSRRRAACAAGPRRRPRP
jgi:GH15 family glucan-1,4-alpha-glucosidase